MSGPTSEQQSLQGREFRPENFEALVAAVREVVDYRGDVTLVQKDGTSVTGYVFNADLARPETAYVEYFPSTRPARERLDLCNVVAVRFSGKDMASGRSWEAWVAKWDAKKKAEAEGRAYTDPIEPQSTHLDPDA